MVLKIKQRASLEEILASTSDVLFPDELGKHPVAIDSSDCEGDTPLHVVIWREDYYAANVLIEAGANIDAIGDMGETPLHVAVTQKAIPVIESLLKAGAKVNIRSEFNDTAVERARKKGSDISALFRDYAES